MLEFWNLLYAHFHRVGRHARYQSFTTHLPWHRAYCYVKQSRSDLLVCHAILTKPYFILLSEKRRKMTVTLDGRGYISRHQIKSWGTKSFVVWCGISRFSFKYSKSAVKFCTLRLSCIVELLSIVTEDVIIMLCILEPWISQSSNPRKVFMTSNWRVQCLVITIFFRVESDLFSFFLFQAKIIKKGKVLNSL